MAGEKDGLKAALETLDATAEPAGEAVEQLELLPSLPASSIGEDGQSVARRGPGRPPGARNRSTEEWRRHLLQRFGSPLEALLSIATANVQELAAQMGIKRGEAFGHQVRALEAALPYLHQKLPQAVEVTGNDAPVLVLNVSQHMFDQVAQPGREGGVTLEGTIEENQGVSDDDDTKV